MKKYMYLAGCLLLTGCMATINPVRQMQWKNGQQMILVISENWQASSGKLSRFERNGHHWRPIGKMISVSLGKNGLAWGIGLHPFQSFGLQKREGDQRSPAGIFSITDGFGYGACKECKISYRIMTRNDFCIDQSDSPYYGQIMNIQAINQNLISVLNEPMRRDIYKQGDSLYKYGFIIQHNKKYYPDYGSCIFAHLRINQSATTAGCTAMDEMDMKSILSWLDLHRNPVFVLLPKDIYRKKRKIWDLPES